MILTETIGEVMADGIEQGINVGIGTLFQGIFDFIIQHPFLAIAVVSIIIYNNKPSKPKKKRSKLKVVNNQRKWNNDPEYEKFQEWKKKNEAAGDQKFTSNPDWKWDEANQLWRHRSQWDLIPQEPKAVPDYSKSYQAKYLLTMNEYQEYKKLAEYADAKGLRICPKVRLLDLVEPRRGEGYMSLLGKVQAKHVDFVITDKNLHVQAILELDDNSHDRPERQERDHFVDEILTSVGYKVIRTRSITEDTLKDVIL